MSAETCLSEISAQKTIHQLLKSGFFETCIWELSLVRSVKAINFIIFLAFVAPPSNKLLSYKRNKCKSIKNDKTIQILQSPMQSDQESTF